MTFPAYADATAGVRSLTDHFAFEWIEQHPDEVRSLLAVDLSPIVGEAGPEPVQPTAPADTDAGTPTSDQARRERDYLNRKEEPAWQL